MEGVTVLNQFRDVGNLEVLMLIVITVAFMLLGILGIYLFIKDKKEYSIAIIYSLFAMGICGMMFASVADQIKTKPLTFQVTISDAVSFTEFNNKYKIIKQDGQIFTITEKGQ